MTSPEIDRLQNQTGEDVALLRPFLATIAASLYAGLVLGTYSTFNPPFVPGYEGRIPYFSPWEVALKWFCLTAALGAYLVGALTLRESGKGVVATAAVVAATLVAVVPLTQAVQARDREYAENYRTCRQIDPTTYRCDGSKVRVSGGLTEAGLERELGTGPPPFPHEYGFFAAVSLGLAIFSAAPRWRRGKPGRAEISRRT